jgi:hypothetical protein
VGEVTNQQLVPGESTLRRSSRTSIPTARFSDLTSEQHMIHWGIHKEKPTSTRITQQSHSETVNFTFFRSSDIDLGWIMDNGTTAHATNNEDDFYPGTVQNVDITVQTGAGSTKCTKVGDVFIQNCDTGLTFWLKGVMYLANCQKKLIAQSKLDNAGCTITAQGGAVCVSRGRTALPGYTNPRPVPFHYACVEEKATTFHRGHNLRETTMHLGSPPPHAKGYKQNTCDTHTKLPSGR